MLASTGLVITFCRVKLSLEDTFSVNLTTEKTLYFKKIFFVTIQVLVEWQVLNFPLRFLTA